MIPIFAGRQPNTTAIVGQHGDGAYIAYLLEAVGIHCVRGSSSKGGAQALRQILQEGASGHFVMTPDGPRGPRREMKPGCAFLAGKSGKPVVPTAVVCSNAWYVGSGWTEMMIPKPFSTIHVLTGIPISVSASATRVELEQTTQAIQDAMQDLHLAAKDYADGKEPVRSSAASEILP